MSELAPEVELVLVIGSSNSSNSNRLVDRAIEAGAASHLIDDAGELDPAWLDGVETVMVTAGASAPEHLVEQLLAKLQSIRPSTIEIRTLVDEDVTFALPRSARRLAVVN